MTTREIFFALTRMVLCDQPVGDEITRALTPERLSSLFRLAKSQDLAPLIGDALTRLGLSDAGKPEDPFQNEILLAVFRQEGLRHDLEQASACLENAAIPFIPLKGALLWDLYPQPWMRTSCDIDVLVHPRDVQRAIRVLADECGYKYQGKSERDVSLESPGHTNLELHFQTVKDQQVQNSFAVLENVWQDASPRGGRYRMEMSPELFYFYLVTHMAKHLTIGGCGVRPFLDLWVWRRDVTMDLGRLDALLEEGGLTRFESTARKLAAFWLEHQPPDDNALRLQEYILRNGLYGSVESMGVILRQQRGGKARYLLSRVFESRMNLIDYFPPVERHPWLMPVGQVARWGKLIASRGVKKPLRQLSTGARITPEQIRERQRLMDDLGLPFQ